MSEGGTEATASGYDAAAVLRRVVEPAKRADRSAFARDRARVLHSSALRRLAAKTQVVVPWEDDFPRTRLTHSLECAQIGRELGAALGCDPDLVETACLAHDLGHPPFGHNGEAALDVVAQPCGGFEGNAQSLRILTRLEAKTLDDAGRSVGLNLTRATLDAACKYPWPRRPGTPKFGVYDDDREAFDWLREAAPEVLRCFEADVMDWSDDIAYSVHDFEDAVHAGHLVLASLSSPAEQDELIALARERYAPDADAAALLDALRRLTDLPSWPVAFDGGLHALARLKDTTSQLIGRFCRAAEGATRAAYGDQPLTRYGARLVVPDEARWECAVLKSVTAHYVMGSAALADNYARQRDVITELASLVRDGAPGTLEPTYREQFAAAADDAARLRAVVDQVASLTDPAAFAWHRRLTAGSR